MNIKTYSVTAYDTPYTDGAVICFSGDTVTALNGSEYNMKHAYILVFDKDGRLYEGGYNVQSHEGSVQNNVYVPAGGFAVIFGDTHPLYEAYLTVTEGAFIPCNTVSLIYPMTASMDKNSNILTLVSEDVPEKKDAKKFLFVGNSCTYINGNPLKFKALCKAAGVDVEVDYCTYGNAFFYEYTDQNHPRGQALRKLLSEKKYDYIVLQDGANCELDRRMTETLKLLELVKQNGATPLLYMRYGYAPDLDGRLEEGSRMYNDFTRLADKYNLPTAPVAAAYLTSLLTYPDIELYADDKSHHSKEGSYLAACCCLYSYLGISPVGNTYTAGLDDRTVKTLQKLAYEECKKYENRNLPEKVEKEVTRYFTEKKKKERLTKKQKTVLGIIAGGVAVAAAIIAWKMSDKDDKK